jgi:hypothetical protein
MWMQCYVCENGLCGHSMQNQRPLECCRFSGTFVDMVFCECVMQNQCTQSEWMLNVLTEAWQVHCWNCEHGFNDFAMHNRKSLKQHICNLVLVDMV